MSEFNQDTTHLVAIVFERLSRIVRSLQHAEGLIPAQWEALRYVAQANRDSRRPGALAEFLGSTRGTVSQTLIALEKKGLIKRQTGAGDGRSVTLELTPAGRLLVANDPIGELERAAGALGADVRYDLLTGLMALLRNIQSQNATEAINVCQTCRYFLDQSKIGKRIGPHRCLLTGEFIDDSLAHHADTPHPSAND